MVETKKNELMHGMSDEDYSAANGLRASELKLLMRSPAHLKSARENPKKPTEAMMFGSVVHRALQNGEKFLDTYVVEPDVNLRTKEGKETLADFRASVKPDAVIVKPEWVEPIKGMLSSVRRHRLVSNLIKNGVRETSVFVDDPETGVALKAKPDLITEEGFLVDWKSTRNAHPSDFTREIFSTNGYFYVGQMAHYNHVLKVAGFSRGESATIIAIEKEPPFGIYVYPLDVGCLGPGEQWRAHLTRLYAKCVNTNEWPCYPERAVQVLPPQWVGLPNEEE